LEPGVSATNPAAQRALTWIPCRVGTLSTAWSVAETGDFNGDGMSDILWQDTSGDIGIWFMNGATVSSGVGLGTVSTFYWSIQGAGAD
jgi:hypothetical protein